MLYHQRSGQLRHLFASNVLFDIGGSRTPVMDCMPMIPNELDLMIISHFDIDHISGIPALLKKTRVRNLWIPSIGAEMRLCLAVDALVRSSTIGYDLGEALQIAKFVADPAGYLIESGHRETDITEVPYTEHPPNLDMEGEEYMMPDAREDRPSSTDKGRGFEVRFSEDKRTVTLLVRDSTWFQFKVIMNGASSVAADPKLRSYADGIFAAIGMSADEVTSKPADAAKALTSAKGLRHIGKGLRVCINDTSMVVACRAVPFSNSITLETQNVRMSVRPSHITRRLAPFQHLEAIILARQTIAKEASSASRLSRSWSALLTGDAGKGSLKYIKSIDAMVLQVPHHGSHTSLSHSFYAENLFKFGVVSCGAVNSFGHPHPAVLQRLLSSGIRVLFATEHGGWSIGHSVWDFIK